MQHKQQTQANYMLKHRYKSLQKVILGATMIPGGIRMGVILSEHLHRRSYSTYSPGASENAPTELLTAKCRCCCCCCC